jgi:hypothetical protein
VGFEAAPAPVAIRFKPGHKYHGAEAQVRGMAIGEYMRATGMDGGEGDNAAASMARFGERLVSWNLTVDGRPLPATPEGMDQADQGLVRALQNAYVESIVGVHTEDPLPESSTSGETSPAPAIPMAPLSESQAS